MTDDPETRSFRAVLGKRVAFGLGVTALRGAQAAAVARQSGYDWLFIDMEHGAFSIAEAGEMCLGAALAGISPFVRCRLDDLATAARLLDNGGAGIVVPRVRDAVEAREIVAALRTPPVGRRAMGGAGLAYPRGTLSGAAGRAEVERQVLVAATIEDAAGVSAVREIAAVEGIDILLLGASDLSFEYGIAGNVGDARIRAAAEAVAAACRERGRVFGVGGIQAPDLVAAHVALGARLVLVGMDHGILSAAAAERIAAFRRTCGAPDASG
jgi:2-keto-3-deoxy-L-rhamnonate aldolase RhmA